MNIFDKYYDQILKGHSAQKAFNEAIQNGFHNGPFTSGFFRDFTTGSWVAFDNETGAMFIEEFTKMSDAKNWVIARARRADWEQTRLISNPVRYRIWVEAWGPEGQYFKSEPEIGSGVDLEELRWAYEKMSKDGDVTNYKIHKSPTFKANPGIDFYDALRTPCSKLQEIGITKRIQILADSLGEHIQTPKVQNTVAKYRREYPEGRKLYCKILKLFRAIYNERQRLARERKKQRKIIDYNPGVTMRDNPPEESVFDIHIKSAKWAKIISLRTPEQARKATAELNKAWKSGDRSKRRRLRRIANLAAVRARIMGQNERLKAATRKQKKVIQSIYERWIKSHPLPTANPPEEPELIGLGLSKKSGTVEKIYSDGKKFFRENPQGSCGKSCPCENPCGTKHNPASPHLQNLSQQKFGRSFEDLSQSEQDAILEILNYESQRMGWHYSPNPKPSKEEIEKHRAKWAKIAKENGWHQEPFHIQIWYNTLDGKIEDSVSFDQTVLTEDLFIPVIGRDYEGFYLYPGEEDQL